MFDYTYEPNELCLSRKKYDLSLHCKKSIFFYIYYVGSVNTYYYLCAYINIKNI